MFTALSRFKSAGRAAVVAAVLGATSLTAMPVQAQPSFNFHLQIPGGGGEVQRHEGDGYGTYHHDDDWRYRCLTNREVRRGIARYGFRNVEIVRELRRDRVIVTAVYGRWLYSMRVDKCTGEVDRVKRERRIGGGGGFEWHFQFGS
jgi:hypothetical protein